MNPPSDPFDPLLDRICAAWREQPVPAFPHPVVTVQRRRHPNWRRVMVAASLLFAVVVVSWALRPRNLEHRREELNPGQLVVLPAPDPWRGLETQLDRLEAELQDLSRRADLLDARVEVRALVSRLEHAQ